LESEIGHFYESPYYISHSNSTKGLFNKTYQLIRNITIQSKLKLISSLAGGDKTLLDMGCGTGEFLNTCSKAGWNVTGIEPNPSARNFATSNYHLNVVDESFLKNLPSDNFKIITLWHVLEHVHSLNERLGDISRLLKTDGYAVIAVPNYKSHDASIYREYWAAYDVPRHLYHFSPETIKRLFVNHSFEWVRSIPMKYDSYYVSMLSEKYKKSSPVWAAVKGTLSGLKSNLAAKKNAEKYSSVIYLFRKKK